MADTLNDPDHFLWIDGQCDRVRSDALAALRRGEFVMESLKTRNNGNDIDVPGGLVHHWLGLVFVPGAVVEQAVALLQDYDHHAEIYAPTVARSRIIERDGDSFRVELRFFMKKVITVVVNSEHEARFARHGPKRRSSRIASTRIAEVELPDTPQEVEKPVGHDGGYMWRLNSYWRFLERAYGTYVQCESISLTRSIPVLLAWMVGPFVNSIPRESLSFTLEKIRQTLNDRAVALSR